MVYYSDIGEYKMNITPSEDLIKKLSHRYGLYGNSNSCIEDCYEFGEGYEYDTEKDKVTFKGKKVKKAFEFGQR